MEQFIPSKILKKLATLCVAYDGTAVSLQTFVDSVAASTSVGDEKYVAPETIPTLSGLSAEDSRDFFNTLAAVFMTGAQNNLPADKFKAFFQSTGAKQQVIDVIARSFQTHRAAMRASLSSIGSDNLTLCDVSWRLDLITTDSEIDDAKELRYSITFVVQKSNDKSGATRELNFFCSMQQLQEIIAKFKLALSAVERLANSPAGTRPGGHMAAAD